MHVKKLQLSHKYIKYDILQIRIFFLNSFINEMYANHSKGVKNFIFLIFRTTNPQQLFQASYFHALFN